MNFKYIRIIFLLLTIVGCELTEEQKLKQQKEKEHKQKLDDNYHSHSFYTYSQSHTVNSETVHVPDNCDKCLKDREKLKQEIIEEVLNQLKF